MSDVDTNANLSDAQVPNGAPATVDTPASPAGPADTAASEQPPGEGDKPQPTRDRRAEKRIASLTRKNDEAQREIGYWRGIAEAKSQGQTTQAPEPNAKPQQSQFKSYDEYAEALIDWKTEEKLKAREAEREQQTRYQTAASKAHEEASRVADRLAKEGAAIEGFDDVMETITAQNFPISATMRDYLGECEQPAHMAQWLADNQAEAARIYGLNSAAAVRALDKVAATLAKPPAKTSSAPAPGPTVAGRAVATRDPEKMDMDEYASHWKTRNTSR